MLLTVSKRLEFSASRRLHVQKWSDAENLSAFGPETNARYGSGRNYVAYFVFTGPVDPTTGMLINISEIKERAGKIVRLSLNRVAGAQRDLLFNRRLRGEFLVRIFRCAQDNVPRTERGRERAPLWRGNFNTRPQLPCAPHVWLGSISGARTPGSLRCN